MVPDFREAGDLGKKTDPEEKQMTKQTLMKTIE